MNSKGRLLQTAKALRDEGLREACMSFEGEITRQASWLLSRIKQAVPQVLMVPS